MIFGSSTNFSTSAGRALVAVDFGLPASTIDAGAACTVTMGLGKSCSSSASPDDGSTSSPAGRPAALRLASTCASAISFSINCRAFSTPCGTGGGALAPLRSALPLPPALPWSTAFSSFTTVVLSGSSSDTAYLRCCAQRL
ncbi:hypothetical protein Vafri_7408 [Volvox africanus]|uniref:Uncharacterized protein n=1 Tax=Volvox africanus TaxID=51714 RepID=A0A8J4EWY4_9CHLO|nr:hypothetical protein Vafri_7408 [Volvox africanus]